MPLLVNFICRQSEVIKISFNVNDSLNQTNTILGPEVGSSDK